MTPVPLQFGDPDPTLTYADRRAAFGVAERDGKIACVRIDRGPVSYVDLPGGALDPGESEERALAREFGEETGLVVEAGAPLVQARQYFVKADGQAVNNQGAVFSVVLKGEDPALRTEDDHTLVWLDPVEALAALRHGSHAFAVAAWMQAHQTVASADPRGARRRG